MSAGILRRSIKHRRSRRRNGEASTPQPATPILIDGVGLNSAVLRLTFDQVVSLHGIPKITTDIEVTALGAAQTAPNQVEITFSGSISEGSILNIPYRDPAIRNASGGYVISPVRPIP